MCIQIESRTFSAKNSQVDEQNFNLHCCKNNSSCPAPEIVGGKKSGLANRENAGGREFARPSPWIPRASWTWPTRSQSCGCTRTLTWPIQPSAYYPSGKTWARVKIKINHFCGYISNRNRDFRRARVFEEASAELLVLLDGCDIRGKSFGQSDDGRAGPVPIQEQQRPPLGHDRLVSAASILRKMSIKNRACVCTLLSSAASILR